MGDSYRDEIRKRQRRWSPVERHRANSGVKGPRDQKDWERERIKVVNAFFSKKRTYPPSKAQLRLWRFDA